MRSISISKIAASVYTSRRTRSGSTNWAGLGTRSCSIAGSLECGLPGKGTIPPGRRFFKAIRRGSYPEIAVPQRPVGGEHLLLAAREPAAEVVHAFGEPGEEHQHLGERPRVGRCAAVSGERDQVLPHAEVGEDLASFGDERDAAARDAVGPLALDALAAETDDSASRRKPQRNARP